MQSITDIAELLQKKGLRQAVISPGSRSAPLTLAFARHEKIRKFIIPDERSAAFIALGLAQASDLPVALICTSGTAVLNYAPAIAEAFYARVPLLVLTADRPTEWTEQQDGQTIRQQNIYQNYVKASFQLLPDRENPATQWHINRTLNEAYNLAASFPPGPVHVNVPLREPLYAHEWAGFSENLRAIEETESEKTLPETFWEKFLPFWNASEKKLVISGRGQFEGKISRFLQKMNFTKIADAPANIKDPDCIRLHDVFLSEKLEALRPEILITFGEEVLSKKLKTFIRKNSPERHFHLSPAGYVPDTFGTLTDILRVEPEYFFGQLFKRQACGLSRDYFSAWQDYEQSSKAKLQAIFAENTWAEWRIANFIFEKTPEKAHLHLGNSMPVRYANIFDWGKKSVKIWANRGTSGIDGSTSTAVGHALFHSETTHYLWSGDVSFLYDRNAFWHEYLPQNLKIIVFNNAGGGIFKMIDGPKKWAECDEYFVTKQSKTARKTAEEHDFDYFEVRNFDELQKASDVFFSSEKRCIMEIFTDLHENTRFYERVMS